MRLDAAHDLMRHALAAGRTAGGYLIAGPLRGAARVLTERLIQELMCTAPKRPCGVCRACRLTLRHAHPDALWIEPEKKSRRISVDQVRQVQGRVYRTSFEGGWRVCVVSGADRMTAEAANAFLKSLEEPPPKCVIFLLTDSPQSLLPTIVSRCQRIALEEEEDPLDPAIEERLAAVLRMPPGRCVTAVAQADALKALLQSVRDGVEDEVRSEISDADPPEKEEIDARVGSRFRERQAAIVRFIMLWQRDLLVLLCGAEDAIRNTDHLETLRSRCATLSIPDALRNIAAIDEIARRLERNMTGGAVFEAAFSDLR